MYHKLDLLLYNNIFQIKQVDDEGGFVFLLVFFLSCLFNIVLKKYSLLKGAIGAKKGELIEWIEITWIKKIIKLKNIPYKPKKAAKNRNK